SEQAEGPEETEDSEDAGQVDEPGESHEHDPFPLTLPEVRTTSPMPGSGTLRPRAGSQTSGSSQTSAGQQSSANSRGASSPAAQTRGADDRGTPPVSRPRP